MPQRSLEVASYTDPRVLVVPTLTALRSVYTEPPTATPAAPAVQTGSGSMWTGEPWSVAILIGGSAAFDASPKIYIWDPTSVAADNGTSVIQPGNGTSSALATGRWRSP